MTSFLGAGTPRWAGALAAASRTTEIEDQSETSVLFKLQYGGDDFFVSLSNFADGLKWPGGSPDDGEVPSGPVTNIRVYDDTTQERSDIFSFSTETTVDDVLGFESASEVRSFLFSGNDVMGGSTGADLFEGLAGDDELLAGGGADTLAGGLGDDTLDAFTGADLLDGSKGADELTGGRGRDLLTGGNGRDLFLFERAEDSGRKLSERDVITDFDRGADRLDFDARFSDRQDLAFVGKAAFDGAYQLRFEADDRGVVVFGNLDGGADAEFSVRLDGVTKVSGEDFIL